MMVQASIPWSPAGHYERMWLDLPVEKTREIAHVMDQIGADLPGRPAKELHMTLVHLGRPHMLLAELRAWGVDVTLPQFRVLLEDLFTRWRGQAWPAPANVMPKRLAVFGSERHPVVVAEMEVTRELRLLHGQLWAGVVDLLLRCGVSEPGMFAERSDNLCKSLPGAYRPHASLFRSDRPLAAAPDIRLDRDPLPVGEVTYHGVHFL